MDKIAILVPCYNEEQTVQKVVTDAKVVFPDASIYVYDNNSTDKTVELARKAGAIVRFEHMQGKGSVVRRMFREIEAECYIIVDGDDTYPMEFAAKMADKVLAHNADMVVGDRLSSTYFAENKRPFHNVGNTLVRTSINHLFGCEIKDIMTGFRAFSYAFVKTFPVLSSGFEIETEMTIHAVYNKLQIENIVIEYRDRPNGSESKLNTYSDGRKVLGTIVRLYRNYRPLAFFNTFALILMLLSISFSIPVVLDYVRTGMVERFPTLFVCGFALLVALQSFFSGLILESLSIQNRRKFELDLVGVNNRLNELRCR